VRRRRTAEQVEGLQPEREQRAHHEEQPEAVEAEVDGAPRPPLHLEAGLVGAERERARAERRPRVDRRVRLEGLRRLHLAEAARVVLGGALGLAALLF
jgi:hypothetical protein